MGWLDGLYWRVGGDGFGQSDGQLKKAVEMGLLLIKIKKERAERRETYHALCGTKSFFERQASEISSAL